MAAKAIEPLEPLENVGLEKESVDVECVEASTTSLSPQEQKKLMSGILSHIFLIYSH